MEQVISNLKTKEIIYRKSVEVLKAYIENKYPEANEQFRAQVFADAIHKIIDDNIREFRRGDQRRIKQELLARTASKDNFEIVAYDIMKTCVALDINEETFVSHLTSWINRQQPVPVYREQMTQLTELVQEELALEQRTQEIKEESSVKRQEIDEAAISEAIATDTKKAIIENNRQSASVDESLLDQLVTAFEYDPYGNLPDSAKPELYTQGMINEAYEAEIRKEQKDLLAAVQVTEGLPSDDAVMSDEVTIIHELEGGDLISDMDDRPIIKVSMDQEPYFSETPELWEDGSKQLTLLDKLKAMLGDYSRKKVILALVGAVGILIITGLVIAMAYSLSKQPSLVEEPITLMVSSEGGDESLEDPLTNGPTEPSANDHEIVIEDDGPSHLHPSLQFKEVDKEVLQSWFIRNGSMVGQTPYFETIYEVAKNYGVNPLLLFAITGQEQGFVPVDHEFAKLMINNPFNVYGSWEIYNTDIEESTQIAARTVLTASEERPDDIDPVDWINRTYAEDEGWSVGVNLLLDQLEAVAGN